jgi:hypothetical protein
MAAREVGAVKLACGQRPVRLPDRHTVTRLPHGEACRGVACFHHDSEA